MLSEELRRGLDVALNEATLLGFELDAERALAWATFSVLALASDGGSMPADARLQLLFRNVSRLAVSHRNGRWDDPAAPVLPVAIHGLLETVQSFGGEAIYGWEFFDVAEDEMAAWGDRLSLDWRARGDGKPGHSLCVFQEGVERHLDLCVWFERIESSRADGTPVPLEEVAAGGRRWWDAFYARDPRTD